MFSEFKSLELFRHQVSSRVEKSMRRYADQSKKSSEKITNNIFSACCSLLVSFLAYNYFAQNTPKKVIIPFLLFIIAYIIAYWASHWIIKGLSSAKYNLKHHGQTLTNLEAKELVDDFDHIACDNNLIGKLFTRAFESEKDVDVKVSSDITLRVLENSKLCINTLEKTSAVDLHRIYNQLDMLTTAKDFLLNHISDKELDAPENLKLVIISQIYSMEEKLNRIKEECDNFKNDHFSDKQVELLRTKYGSILINKP